MAVVHTDRTSVFRKQLFCPAFCWERNVVFQTKWSYVLFICLLKPQDLLIFCYMTLMIYLALSINIPVAVVRIVVVPLVFLRLALRSLNELRTNIRPKIS